MYNRIPWYVLTRHGIPAFKIFRQPIGCLGEVLQPGTLAPPVLQSNPIRLRQLYEAALAEPVLVDESRRVGPVEPVKPVQSFPFAAATVPVSEEIGGPVPKSLYVSRFKKKKVI